MLVSSSIKRLVALVTLVTLVLASACADDNAKASVTPASAVATTAADSTARRDTAESGGEVALTSSTIPDPGVWLTDANVLALLAGLNGRQIAAADVELQAWHSETVRAFAASMAREHAELARSIDSLSRLIKITPVAPALASRVIMAAQAQIDSLRWLRAGSLDRAYVRHQVSSHESMAQFVEQLGAVAERPELQALLASAVMRFQSQLTRAKALDAILAAADSAAAVDSLAKLEARRKRQSRGR